MKKMLIIFGMAVLFIVVGLTGCFDSNNDNERNSELDRFVGTWIGAAPNEITFTFFYDGTGNYSGSPTEWKIKDGKLEIYWLDREITQIYDFEFLENNEILTLTEVASGYAEIYTKQ